ncbi:N-acetylmuramoyl-L-alanine amidase [Georgenia sp. SYP-B2076]|uniref:N-acetylmuramoyl-L-alanine amidase n=1 Tax=Georgenia sp. SYP-B2076 TaxID=2495881 RepID=UPI000F8D899C|nr:N-acetylmuramoyl-L-alanine amidase [Georgenia sp. SYP-B2076]
MPSDVAPTARPDEPEGPRRRAVVARRLVVALVALGVVAIGLYLALRLPPAHDGVAAPSASPVAPSPEPRPLDGLHVVLDPGHNGGNGSAAAEVNALVEDGRGAAKACNTVGTSTASGYPEHAFTWDVAVRARAVLEADGAQVTLTRESDDGVGPCVDVRGRMAQDLDADLTVSLHADGADDPTVRGYFAIVSAPPLNEAQGTPSLALARALLEALAGAGFTPSSSYPGALSERADLATLNWAQRPAVMLELAEMRNPEEASLTESEDGRQRYADAVAAGIAGWAAG